MKTLIRDIRISSVKEAEEILKAAGTEDLFEKAHFDGEMHPNGKLVWRSSANNGKGDWRVAKKKKDNNEWKIVDDVNNGKKINEIYAKWENIKTDKDFKKWKEEVRENMFGTTKNKTILDIIDNFNPKFKNEIVKKDFLRELKEAYESKPKNLDDVLTKLDERSKKVYNRMDEEKKSKGEKTILEKSKNLFSLFVKSDKYFKGHLYHVDGTKVTRDSIEKRISESKNNMAVILDVLGTKGEDKIERSDMKDDKIAGSYGIVKNNNTGMFELLKFEDD